MVYDTFISYASEDVQVAEAVRAVLKANGIRCWMAPDDIPFGVDYREAIIDAIAESRSLVLIFSKHSNDNYNVQTEVLQAARKSLRVLPVRIEKVPISKKLTYHIGTLQWLDAFTPPLEQHLQRLADGICALLGRRGNMPTSATETAQSVPATKAANPVRRPRIRKPRDSGQQPLDAPSEGTRRHESGAPRSDPNKMATSEAASIQLAPIRSAFKPDGRLDEQAVHADVISLLARARAESAGHSQDVAGVVDLLAAAIDCPKLAQEVATRFSGGEATQRQIQRFIRDEQGSQQAGPLPRGETYRRHLSSEVVALMEIAAAAVGRREVQVQDLIEGLLSRPEFALVLGRLATLGKYDSGQDTGGEVSVRQWTQPGMGDYAGAFEKRPTDDREIDSGGTLLQTYTATEVFDSFGQFAPKAVNPIVFGILAAAVREAKRWHSDAVGPAHILKAIVDHPDARRAIDRSESNLALVRKHLGSYLCGDEDTPADVPSPTALPQQDDFSAETQLLLQTALEGAGAPLDWRHLLTVLLEHIGSTEAGLGTAGSSPIRAD
jgi:hypothetical protein